MTSTISLPVVLCDGKTSVFSPSDDERIVFMVVFDATQSETT